MLYSSGKYNIYIDANKYRFSTIYGEKNPIGDFINAQHNNNGEVISLWDFDFRKTSVAPQLSYSLWRDGYKYSIIKNCIPLFNKAKALQYFNFDTEESYFIPKNFSSFTLGSTFKLNNSKIYFFPNKDVKYFIYCLEDRMFVIFISNTTTGVSFAYLYDANMFYTIYTPVEGYFTTSFLNFGVKFVSCLDVSQYNKEDLNGLQLFWSNCISLFKDLKSRDAHKIK